MALPQLAPPAPPPPKVSPRPQRQPGGGKVPHPLPAPQPQKIPVLPPVIVTLIDIENSRQCPPSQDHEVARCFTPGTPKKGKKRQRPCGGAKPIVTFEERRRFKGVIFTPPRFPWSSNNLRDDDQVNEDLDDLFPPCETGQLSSKTIIHFEFAGLGYGSLDKQGQEWVDKNSSLFDKFRSEPSGAINKGLCAYKVYEITQRRKCSCPDGSPCRKANYT